MKNHLKCLGGIETDMDVSSAWESSSEISHEEADEICSSSIGSSSNSSSFTSRLEDAAVGYVRRDKNSSFLEAGELSAAGICSLAVSNECVYAGFEDGQVCCWRRGDAVLVDRFGSKGKGSVRSIQLLSSNVVITAQDCKIRIWKRRTPKPQHKEQQQQHEHVATLPKFLDRVTSSIFPTKHIRIRRHETCPWNQHFDKITCIAIGSDRDSIYTASWDRTIKVWSFSRGLACVESIAAHSDAVNALLAAGRRQGRSTGGAAILSGSADGTVRVWERRDGGHSLAATLEHRSGVNALAAGDYLYAGCSDGTIAVWETLLGCDRPREVLRGHRRAVLCVAAAARNVLCSGSADGSARIWMKQSGGGGGGVHLCVAVLRESRGTSPVRSIAAAVAGDGCVVYCGASDGSLKNWWVPLIENEEYAMP